jgi:hypothetical protein
MNYEKKKPEYTETRKQDTVSVFLCTHTRGKIIV